MQIQTKTGQEWHTSYGAKGYVFVVGEDGKEKHIHEAPQARKTDIDWQEVQRGKHGKWAITTYEIPEGTILKLFAVGTWRNKVNEGGSQYFVVDSTAPYIQATGGDYDGRGGRLRGNVRPLSLEDVADMGIEIPADFKRYYKPGKIAIQEMEVA